MKLEWLDRSLLTSPVFYTLATSPEIAKAELKRMKFDGHVDIPKGKGATANFLVNAEGKSCAIVCLYDHSQEINQIHALLVHEAAHIWQEICQELGEKSPSDEFEAYSIQRIAQSLFYEYDRQRKRKKK